MWQFIFWLSLGIVLYTYLGYPLCLLILRWFRVERTSTFSSDATPSICLVISAFNEQKVIAQKIENSLGLDYPKHRYRIVVASDGSDDDTVSLVNRFGDKGVELFHQAARHGKSAVLNTVISGCSDEIVVFTDANSLFAKDALKKMVRHFHDPRIGCVVGKLRYVDRHTTQVARGEGLYWKYEGKLSVLESALRKVLVANGSIFAIRRELHSELYPEVANDFQIPTDIAAQGFGVIYEPEATAFESSTVRWQEEFQRKVRIIIRGLTGFTRLRNRFTPFRLWQFFSHKLLRWAVGPLLVVNLIANALLVGASTFYTVFLVAQIVFYLAALNGWRIRRTRKPQFLFYLPFYFTMVNLAATVAFAKFVSGQRKTVWEKSESARFAPTESVLQSTPSVATPLNPPVRRPAPPATERVAKS